jgi:hypothetical protein
MIISEYKVDLKQIEREIFRVVCEIGREMYREYLERFDEYLMVNRDRQKYRHKGKKQTTLKTVMGEVVYERAQYRFTDENGDAAGVYLLDEVIGEGVSGQISPLLSEKIVETSCELSYRKTAEAVSAMTGQTISHGGVWNVIQELGDRADKREREDAQLNKLNQSRGKREAKLLFEEQDGIWLNLQGQDRKKLGSSAEMKIAIAYDGAKQTGKSRFNLANKVACANFEGIDKFIGRKEGVIASCYNVDEVEQRIVNGDGAKWVRRSLNDDTAHFQLDPYHRNKAVFEHVSDPDARKIIFKLLYTKQIDTMFDVIDAYANSSADEHETAHYRMLETYFKNNRDGLVSYKHRGLELPQPPEGLVYRGCGAMESNVFSLIGRRMKRRRANWSISGGNNMARLLTLKSTGRLSRALSVFSPMCLPETHSQSIADDILSVAKSHLRVGKGYNGFRHAAIPAKLPFMKEIFSLKSLI